MEENNLEQNTIEPIPQSSIDQITKVPLPKPKPKVKNPKRVAAGKKLAEHNRKARQSRDAIQEEEKEEENHNDSFLPSTSFTTIIAFIGLGLTALDLFLRYKSTPVVLKMEENNEDVDETEHPQNDLKIKELNPHHIGGME